MSRHAYCSFCDDVRLEAGNKLSIMGIYGGELVVPVAPFVLARLCCVIGFLTPVENPVSSLSLVLRANGADIARGEVPPQQLVEMRQRSEALSSTDDPISRYSLSFPLAVNPYLVSEPHVIKAFAIADGEELPAGRLYVSVGTPRS